MNKHEIMKKAAALLEETKTAVLAVTDKKKNPTLRWMSPIFIPGIRHLLYAITSPQFSKIESLSHHSPVEWMIQNPLLTEIITIRGRAFTIDNPSLRNQVMNIIGPHLHAFWKLNTETTEFVVLETVIEEMTYYQPIQAKKEHISFIHSTDITNDR